MFKFLIGTKVLERTTSKYNGDIKVIRDLAWGKYIVVNNLTQSGGILFEVWQSTLRKLQKTRPEVKNCLILGLGGGSVAKIVSKNWPDAKITGVDIDEKMVNLGKKYLGLDTSKTKIIIQDAYEFISGKYDLILIDLYCGDKIPQKFEDEKFLKNVKKMLDKNGIVIFNKLYGSKDKAGSIKFGKKLERYFKKVDYFYPQANVELICYN